MTLARAERIDLADFLDTLTPEQWQQQSLCSAWSVHDVVAHAISYEDHSQAEVFGRIRKAGFRPGRINDVALEGYRDMTNEQLVVFLRSHLDPKGSTAKFDGRVGLADAVVHHQDIRRPLGLPRDIPEDRLRISLDFSVWAPPLRGFWHARGVRMVATDLDWAHGRGPVAEGPAEAVLMAMVGRAGVAHELSGPGADILARRLG
ncbi:MAG: maleylpyruvate isomerase family mycothiol-dependent enzyme [Rhodococcus sp.]|nr:maleylpyruvate isomerase family mycothiol-dependent enzyme [Rhodococcus sp. (in: high G+C Gram-positive bacteria)]